MLMTHRKTAISSEILIGDMGLYAPSSHYDRYINREDSKELKEAGRHGIYKPCLRRKMEEVEAAKRVGELFSRISEEEVVSWIKEARKER